MKLKVYLFLFFASVIASTSSKAATYYMHPYHSRCMSLWGPLRELSAEISQLSVENSPRAHVSRLEIPRNRAWQNEMPVYRFEIAKDYEIAPHHHGDRFIAQFGIASYIHPISIVRALMTESLHTWRLPSLTDATMLFESQTFRNQLRTFNYRGETYYLFWNIPSEPRTEDSGPLGRYIKITLTKVHDYGTPEHILDFIPTNTEPIVWEMGYFIPVEMMDSELEELALQVIRTQGTKPVYMYSDAHDQFPVVVPGFQQSH